MEIYQNTDGIDCVKITNADGSMWSGLKSAYDAQQAKSVYDTLASESTNDPAGNK